VEARRRVSRGRLPGARLKVEDSRREAEMKAELNIEGMHCDSCAADIKETLEDVAGVRQVDVTFKRKTAIVEFDAGVAQQSTLIKKIQDLGYQATVAGESQSGVGA
jgi:copper chaperone CopZ